MAGKFHHPFGEIVVDRESAVFGVAAQRLPLIERVRDGLADRALGKHTGLLCPQPGFEGVQNGNGMRPTVFVPVDAESLSPGARAPSGR